MTQEQDAYFMEKAIDQAELGLSRGQAPFGAVVVGPDGTLIGEGHNTSKADFDPSAHGEIVAIRAACKHLETWDLQGCTLYTSCEPCLLCSFVITQTGIGRVVFAARALDVSTYKPLLDADLSQVVKWVNAQPDWSPLEVVGDFMRERAKKSLNAYFKS